MKNVKSSNYVGQKSRKYSNNVKTGEISVMWHLWSNRCFSYFFQIFTILDTQVELFMIKMIAGVSCCNFLWRFQLYLTRRWENYLELRRYLVIYLSNSTAFSVKLDTALWRMKNICEQLFQVSFKWICFNAFFWFKIWIIIQ